MTDDLTAAVARLRDFADHFHTRQSLDIALVLSALESAQAAMPPREPTRHPCGHLIVSDECVACAQDQSAATPAEPHGSVWSGRASGADGPAADPIAELCARLRSHYKRGGSFDFALAADALERLARERDDIRTVLQNTNRDAARLANIADKYKWQVRDTCIRAERAEAERDTLRAIVRAADMCLRGESLRRDYDRARAAWKGEV